LPVLTNGDAADEAGDCWQPLNDHSLREGFKHRILEARRNTTKSVFVSPMTDAILGSTGYLKPIVNETIEFLAGIRSSKPRKTDHYPKVKHCQRPQVVGGGKGPGVLWNLWLRMPKAIPDDNETRNDAALNTALIATVLGALRPKEKWRTVAHECVRHNLDTEVGSRTVPPYLALHARVEVDMMVHKCGAKMEKNLSNIFDMADSFVKEYNINQSAVTSPEQTIINGTFVAVSRNSMRLPWKSKNIQDLSKHNWEVLNERSPHEGREVGANERPRRQISSRTNGKATIFECGEAWIDRWYQQQQNVPRDYYGSILPSILNFYIATEAAVFIGVDKSSWSTDVWTTRFYLGKGSSNFKYTPTEGILPVSSGGLPPPHKNC
jgi:hypothetical protein